MREIFQRLESQMPDLLAEMRDDLHNWPLRRELVLLHSTWTYWAGGDEFEYYFDKHPDLTSKFQILSNYGLVSDITFNEVQRYLMSETLAAYLCGEYSEPEPNIVAPESPRVKGFTGS